MAAVLAEGVWNRKASRYDYKRFDHASTSASVGYRSIGKVDVDCRFHFRKSKWGKLGAAENAAGVIYMELNFHQPPDCILQSATIQVTLDEDDEGLKPYRLERPPTPGCPVQITDFFGPRQIVGTSKRILVNKSLNIAPSLNVAGNGGSFGSKSTEKTFEKESRWMFQSYRVPNAKTQRPSSSHRTLRYEMVENNVEENPVHSNTVLTAFAYEHSGQPFLMKVEVSGKLRQRSSRMKASLAKNLKKFGPRARRQEDISTTLVGAYLGDRSPLDELAEGLASEMEKKNYLVSPPVMPDTQTTSFQQVAFDALSSTNPAVQYASGTTSEQEFIERTIPKSGLDLDRQMLNIGEGMRVSALRDRTEPTLENLARVGEYFRTSIRRDTIRSDKPEASAHSSATTLVTKQSVTPLSMATLPQNVDEQALARVMEISFMRLLIKFMVGIMDFLMPGGGPGNVTGEKQKEDGT